MTNQICSSYYLILSFAEWVEQKCIDCRPFRQLSWLSHTPSVMPGSNTGRQRDMAKQTGLLCEEIKQAFFILHLIMVQ